MDQIVPITQAPNTTQSVSLQIDGGTIFLQLKLKMNEIAGYWVMTINDQNGNLLMDSIPLLTGMYPGANILSQYTYLGIGSAYVINSSQSVQDWPDNIDGFGANGPFVLIWGDTPGTSMPPSSGVVIPGPTPIPEPPFSSAYGGQWLNFRAGSFDVSTGPGAWRSTGLVTDKDGFATISTTFILVGAEIQISSSGTPSQSLSASGTYQIDAGPAYPWSVPTLTGDVANGQSAAAAYYMQFQPPVPVNQTAQSQFVTNGTFVGPSGSHFIDTWAVVGDSSVETPYDAIHTGVSLVPLPGNGSTSYGQFGSVFATADLTFTTVDLYLGVVNSLTSGQPLPASPFIAPPLPSGTTVTVNFQVHGSSTTYTATLTSTSTHVQVPVPSTSVTAASLAPALTWNCQPPPFTPTVSNSKLMLSIKLGQPPVTPIIPGTSPLVQSNTSIGGSRSVAFTEKNTAGNCILVAALTMNYPPAGIFDTAGNTYTQISSVAANVDQLTIWYVPACAAFTGNTVSVIVPGGFATVIVTEYANIASSPIDVFNAVGNGPNPIAPNLTTTQANDVLVFVASSSFNSSASSGDPWTETGGYMQRQEQAGVYAGIPRTVALWDAMAGAAGPYSDSASVPGSGYMAAWLIALKSK